MASFDDEVADGVEDAVADCGTACVYIRSAATSSVTLIKRPQPVQQVQTITGHIVEVSPVDFVGLTRDLPYDPPLKGDRIKIGEELYEVQPITSSAVYQRLHSSQTRLHTKKVN